MKKIAVLALLAGLILGGTQAAQAVDFKASGRWIFGFGGADSSFVKNPGTKKSQTGNLDTFDARQMMRLRLEAVASESLSGVVHFEVGNQKWGTAGQGAALGTDGMVVKVKHAYLDWVVPQTNLKLRMGLQAMDFPNAAGGSAIFSDDVAGIVANYRINENVGITALWGRLYNDNFVAGDSGFTGPSNSLDNQDMFLLSVPVTLDGFKVTPFALVAATGKNTLPTLYNIGTANGINVYPAQGLSTAGFNTATLNTKNHTYSTAWWVGLPIAITAWDPWNVELDFNYGVSEGFGRYDAFTADRGVRRASSKREGWLAKGLVEYKLDFGTPGIFGWYGSGDQGVGNGSGRMPHISPWGSFTSFMGDNKYAWSMGGGSTRNSGFEIGSVYSGTWGVGAHIKDMSFIESLTHTLRVAYWGGTNSPSMTKYMTSASGVHSKGWDQIDDSVMYLTTKDHLVEFNLDSTWKIYDNLEATVELAYIINGIDRDQWAKYGNGASWQKADAWKAGVIVCYQF